MDKPVSACLTSEQQSLICIGFTKYEKKNKQDIIIFVGSPGSGKSTFYKRLLQPLGYVRINQDTLKTVCLIPKRRLADFFPRKLHA